MTRVLLFGCVALIAACGSKSFESLCANQVPPPAACNTPCDPAPGASTTCISGFHCASNGKCDTQCTPDGGQCGNGFACTADGFCVSSGGGSGSGGPDIDADCPAVHVTATKTTPSIQLLIDRSGSMLHDFADQTPSGATDPVKFPTEQTALVGAQGVVTQLQTSVYFGASMFPGAACPGLFSTGRALNNLQAITDLLNAHAPDPNANTPTADSINLAVQDFMTNPPPAGSPPIIVLATDGLPNSCTNQTNGATDATVAAATASFNKGIKLFLLVVGTKVDATFEQNLANAGQGVTTGAKAFNATDPTTLANAFQDIIRGVVSCDLTLNGMVDQNDASSGSVTVDGKQINFGTDWSLDPNGTVIHLLGAVCTQVKGEANPVIDAAFPCGGAVIF